MKTVLLVILLVTIVLLVEFWPKILTMWQERNKRHTHEKEEEEERQRALNEEQRTYERERQKKLHAFHQLPAEKKRIALRTDAEVDYGYAVTLFRELCNIESLQDRRYPPSLLLAALGKSARDIPLTVLEKCAIDVDGIYLSFRPQSAEAKEIIIACTELTTEGIRLVNPFSGVPHPDKE